MQLMPRLNEVIGSEDSLHQHRGLLILQQVVKALASKRLRNDRRVFKVFIEVFVFLTIHQHILNVPFSLKLS